MSNVKSLVFLALIGALCISTASFSAERLVVGEMLTNTS